jgi:hypothetical protein
LANFDEAIESAGGLAVMIPSRRRREILQEWRRVYAARLHAITGKWTWLGYDWHVFSYRYAQAYARERASIAYESLEPPARTIVCPHDGLLPAFEIVNGKLPDFRSHGLDITIWPEGFEWTMAFTHEDGWLGPYFSRREWMEGSGD